jgi:drug/metabolite transporter (DMT)-like permease
MTTTSIAPAQTSSVMRAVGWMVGALVSFSVIAIAGREASRVITTTELMFWRGLIGVAILLAIWKLTKGTRADLMSGQPRLQAARSIVHFGAQFAWLFSLTLIPLVELFALEFTAPLWVAVLAPLFLGERLTAIRASAALLGFIGALIVIWPPGAGWSITGFVSQMTLGRGSILALASAIGFACNMMAVKRLTHTDSPFTILLWMNALQAVIGTGFLIYGVTWPDPKTWFWTVLVGIGGLTAHYSLSRAFKLADAIIVAPMDFMRVPLIALVGVFVYDETLRLLVLVGGAFILAANALNIWGERWARAPRR